MEEFSKEGTELFLSKHSEIIFPTDYIEGKYSLFYFPDALTTNYFYIKAKSTNTLQCFNDYENKYIESFLLLFANYSMCYVSQKDDLIRVFSIKTEKKLDEICRSGIRELMKVKLFIKELNIGITIGHDLIICLDYYQYKSEVKNIEDVFIGNKISLSHDIEELAVGKN